MNRLILESGGFQTLVNFESNTEPVVIIDAPAGVTYHHLGINPETGQEINSKQVHIIVNIKTLTNLGYDVFRDEKKPNDPDLLNDIVRFVDANDKLRKFRVIDNRPSNTFGCTVLFFEDVE